MKRLLVIAMLSMVTLPSLTLKIGISHESNPTSISPPTTTDLPATTIAGSSDSASSISPLTEVVSTSGNIFPPRPRATEAPTTTTTSAPKAELQPLNATEAPAHPLILGENPKYYCSCDLQTSKCDLNCCCDRDCPPETRRVFDCHSDSALPLLQSRLEDFQYIHGLPTCQINDGWLCVFRSNTKPAKTPSLFANFDASHYRRWPDILEAYETDSPAQAAFPEPHYKFRQALQLLQSEGKQLTTFDLPTAYEGPHCQLKQSIRHLQPMSSNCLMRNSFQLQKSLWSILNLTATHEVLPKPYDRDERDVAGLVIEVCPKGEDGKFHCLERENDTQIDILAEKVEIQVTHNFTNIIGVKVLIEGEPLAGDDNEPLWLHYKVNFIAQNESYAKPTSSPLGYLPGSPVIISKILPQNNSEEQKQLSYFNAPQSFEDFHWLPLLTRKSREMSCQSTLDQKEVLRLGVDIVKQCQLHQAAPLLQENANHTEYCERLQSQIWSQLLPYNCSSLEEVGQVFISQLGRPQPEKWLPLHLHYPEKPNETPPSVLGVYDDLQQSLTCRNMFLSVRYEFHVADLALLDGAAPHQRVLQSARLVLGHRHDLEFDASEQQVALPLSVSAMFFQLEKRSLSQASGVSITNHIMLFAILAALHF
ncbi:tectonic [Drosophila serrata]|uniref:tectonic n=1 Tax=Drosophila serrata TaxID=7274 RepID=UPI000A1CF4A2|nr:tectonic [Drosophila serrata]